jgi:tRNA dimethylallyltransferase
LAKELGAEIISMDSMALYRHMDILTAKPTKEDRRLASHHLIDVLEPWESASVAWWLEHARTCWEDIRRRGRRTMFVGGTPLYVKALLRGLFDAPAADLNIRHRLISQARDQGNAALHGRLAQLDPITAKRIHPNDLRRTVRALEVLELTGRPMSEWQQQWSITSSAPLAVWLDLPREELYSRINQRVEKMFADGVVEEVRQLGNLPHPLSREARQAVGLAEIMPYVDGKASRQDTIRSLQQRTRNFAKRQITWFRHLPELRPATRELTEALWKSTMALGSRGAIQVAGLGPPA